jgi:hypothetical protein
MSTKSTTTQLTKEEIKYQRKVKAMELAIKSQGRNGITSDALVKVADKIFNYINQ